MNSGEEIRIITPIINTNGNLIFQDNLIEWISNKNILLLVCTISSGRTVNSALECLEYYGGKLAGISSLFLSSHEKMKQKIYTLFTSDDIPDYKLFGTAECEMCRAGQKLDAIINSEGYTRIGQ